MITGMALRSPALLTLLICAGAGCSVTNRDHMLNVPVPATQRHVAPTGSSGDSYAHQDPGLTDRKGKVPVLHDVLSNIADLRNYAQPTALDDIATELVQQQASVAELVTVIRRYLKDRSYRVVRADLLERVVEELAGVGRHEYFDHRLKGLAKRLCTPAIQGMRHLSLVGRLSSIGSATVILIGEVNIARIKLAQAPTMRQVLERLVRVDEGLAQTDAVAADHARLRSEIHDLLAEIEEGGQRIQRLSHEVEHSASPEATLELEEAKHRELTLLRDMRRKLGDAWGQIADHKDVLAELYQRLEADARDSCPEIE